MKLRYYILIQMCSLAAIIMLPDIRLKLISGIILFGSMGFMVCQYCSISPQSNDKDREYY